MISGYGYLIIKINLMYAPQSFDFFSENDMYMKILINVKEVYRTPTYSTKIVYFDETDAQNSPNNDWLRRNRSEVTFISSKLKESSINIRFEMWDEDWFFNWDDDLIMTRTIHIDKLYGKPCFESYNKRNKFCVTVFWKDEI